MSCAPRVVCFVPVTTKTRCRYKTKDMCTSEQEESSEGASWICSRRVPDHLGSITGQILFFVARLREYDVSTRCAKGTEKSRETEKQAPSFTQEAVSDPAKGKDRTQRIELAPPVSPVIHVNKTRLPNAAAFRSFCAKNPLTRERIVSAGTFSLPRRISLFTLAYRLYSTLRSDHFAFAARDLTF